MAAALGSPYSDNKLQWWNMLFKKKHLRYLPLVAIVFIYLASRFYNLLDVPIFTDEAIYTRWAQIASNDAGQRFISLTDGKQPSLIWAGAAFMKFISDPLLAMRLVSLLAGLATTIGVYLLSKELFQNKKVAIAAGALYVIYPFALVYDKLAVYDSMVAMFAVWSLYLQVLLVHYRRTDIALVTAIVTGAALLTKSSALFFLYLVPFSLLLFDRKSKSKEQLKNFALWAGLIAIVIAGSFTMYSILRLSPHYTFIAQKNDLFVLPFSDWINDPFAVVADNSKRLIAWLVGYTTIPILLLAGAAFFVKRERMPEKLLLLAWFILPFAALALFGNPIFLFPRYILFMTIPLLILSAFSIVDLLKKVKTKQLQFLFLFVSVFLMLRMDFYILTNFLRAPLPKVDKAQLIEGYASGVGVKETVDFIEEKSQNEKIYVATQGTFGLMPNALQIHLGNNPNVEIMGYWPITDQIPKHVIEVAQTKPTFFIFYAACDLCPQEGVAPANWPLEQEFQISRQEKNSYFTVYQVIAN